MGSVSVYLAPLHLAVDVRRYIVPNMNDVCNRKKHDKHTIINQAVNSAEGIKKQKEVDGKQKLETSFYLNKLKAISKVTS